MPAWKSCALHTHTHTKREEKKPFGFDCSREYKFHVLLSVKISTASLGVLYKCFGSIRTALPHSPGPPRPGWAGHGPGSASPPTTGDGTSPPSLLPSPQGTLPAGLWAPVEERGTHLFIEPLTCHYAVLMNPVQPGFTTLLKVPYLTDFQSFIFSSQAELIIQKTLEDLQKTA